MALGQHARGEVGDRDPKVGVAEVDADRRAGGGLEREQDAGAPAAAGAWARGAVLDHQPRVVKLADEGGHRRAGESRDAGDVGAAGGAGPAQDVDDLRPVAVSQGAEGAVGPGGCGHRVNLSSVTGFCQ